VNDRMNDMENNAEKDSTNKVAQKGLDKKVIDGKLEWGVGIGYDGGGREG